MTEAQKTLYYIAENMRMDKSISKEGYEHFQQAIKALEQEPILDKIRAEIIARDRNVKTVRNDGRCLFTAEEVLRIIDKYRKGN